MTGHKGCIGTVMVPTLVQAGHTVVGLDSDLFQQRTFRQGIFDVGELCVDLRDVQSRDFESFDAVIHLAALSNDTLGDLNPAITCDINHAASVRLARLAREVGVPRFLYSSWCSSYGKAGDDLVDESAALHPMTVYAISKVRVERDVAELANDHFSPTFLRNAIAYGASRGCASISCSTISPPDLSRRGACTSRATARPGAHRRRRRHFACVPGRAGGAPGKSSATKRSTRDGGPDPAATASTSAKSTAYCRRPQWNARLGAEELYDAYRHAGLVIEDCEGPRFKRIDHLKHLLAASRVDTLRWRTV